MTEVMPQRSVFSKERGAEMTRLPMDCLITLVLCCLPALVGCHDAEKQKALADLQSTETALASAHQELATTRATLDKTQKERDRLQKELQNVTAQCETQRKQVDKLTADMQASEAQREQLKKRVDELTAQVQACEAQREQLKKQLATAGEAATKENESLKTKMAALEKDLVQKEVQIRSLQEKTAELQKKLEAALKPPAKPAS